MGVIGVVPVGVGVVLVGVGAAWRGRGGVFALPSADDLSEAVGLEGGGDVEVPAVGGLGQQLLGLAVGERRVIAHHGDDHRGGERGGLRGAVLTAVRLVAERVGPVQPAPRRVQATPWFG